MGIRFQKAACVYPCEFNTSFMPATANAAARELKERPMECTHLVHTGLGVSRICLGCTNSGVPELNPSQPKDEFLPRLVEPCKLHG